MAAEVIGKNIDFNGKIPKTAGLRPGNSPESCPALLKIVCYVKIFQFSEMINESKQYLITT